MALILSHDDIAASLKALDDDIEAHPDRLRPISSEMLQRIGELTRNVDIDLDAPLADEDEEVP